MPHNDLLRFEKEAWEQGYTLVAGIDEAGRGPIAGPVVAAVVILQQKEHIDGITDSKLLSSEKRKAVAAKILSLDNVYTAVGVVHAPEIDQVNILQATYLAMQRALNTLSVAPDFVLVDGNSLPRMEYPARAIVKGDSRSDNIAAASILAKEARDELMVKAAKQYPAYGFAEHKGYATAAHLEALRKFGPCNLHRKSFSPVSCIINGGYYQPELFSMANGDTA